MNSADVITSNDAFEPTSKKDPRLVWRKKLCPHSLRSKHFVQWHHPESWSHVLCCTTTSWMACSSWLATSLRMLLEMVLMLKATTWSPPFQSRRQITPATAIAVKIFDMNTSNRREVLRALAQLTRKTVNTLASDDISFQRPWLWDD